MIYSVYNYGTHAYDYFDGGPSTSTHAPVPPKARGPSSLGATPDQAAWPLPAGARKIGSGPNARGRVATRGEAGMGDVSVAGIPATLIAAGVAAWFLLRKKKG